MDVVKLCDLFIGNARVVTPDGVCAGGVGVTGGRITAVVGEGTEVIARHGLDARGRYVLPGLIDSHVHFRTPGLTDKEDWSHGSRAACAGGVTTVCDMPNTNPPLLTDDDAAEKHELISGTSLVDYRFHAAVDPERPHLLKGLTARTATSAKLFMTGHHTAQLVAEDDQLDAIFAVAADAELTLLIHAESAAVFRLLDQWRGKVRGYGDFAAHRPRSGPVVAAARVIELVQRHGTRAHVVHVSAAEEADLLCAAAHAGLPVTFEVTAHHLSFRASDAERLGARIRLSPAIRDDTDRDHLWEAVFDERVTTLGSDHAPHLLADKFRPVADAPPGLPGVQELLPAVVTAMARRRPEESSDVRLSRIVRLLAANPAKLLGLNDRKGSIAPGYDADLVIFDPDVCWSLSAAEVWSKCGWSAYEGSTFTGRPDLTMLRGRVVYDRAAAEPFGKPVGTWLDVGKGAML